jgi:hypothetical protein
MSVEAVRLFYMALTTSEVDKHNDGGLDKSAYVHGIRILYSPQF